jgi:hypothetical protein
LAIQVAGTPSQDLERLGKDRLSGLEDGMQRAVDLDLQARTDRDQR